MITPVSTVLKGKNTRNLIFISFIFVYSGRTRKSKGTDVAANYTENKLITAVRAMHEYLLKPL